jgi:hypothetical protein
VQDSLFPEQFRNNAPGLPAGAFQIVVCNDLIEMMAEGNLIGCLAQPVLQCLGGFRGAEYQPAL